ncbi:hypothetical protein JCM3775_007625 [Rhodotorula graminis]|uniref:Uncharacterized protein n=1 Tax=Rhodotorula graminis (strain WP1) TaxID=578459 RepID=A0A0P9GGM2_RHOGW|nr:uncharacterized protein RHOBADRAFT_56159 [Rhodotorula graminis WP1]KPV72023.1 hypothetical protein RHOBADRAFT_56159 [Rhodotorula graminis WP1]
MCVPLPFFRSSSYHEYKPVLDHFYLGVSAIFAIPLQAVFFAAAVAFSEPAVLIPGTAMTCIGLTELVFFLGSGASFGIRNILVVALGGVWALHLYILSIVHTCEARKRGSLAAQKRPVRLPLGIIVSYLLFPWVLFLPFILSCSPHVSYSGYGNYVRFKPYPSDVIGLVLMALAFLVEIGAWYGKLRFDLRRRDAQPGSTTLASSSILSHGIYTITRHPLLFSVPLLSLGIYILVATPAFYAWGGGGLFNRLESPGREALAASVVAPVAIIAAELVFFLPWLERTQQAHYSSLASDRAAPTSEGNVWTAYEVYRSRTSPIVPLPPALYARLPAGAKKYLLGERGLDATAARRLGARGAETGVEC